MEPAQLWGEMPFQMTRMMTHRSPPPTRSPLVRVPCQTRAAVSVFNRFWACIPPEWCG